jgi:hypothetical protein
VTRLSLSSRARSRLLAPMAASSGDSTRLLRGSRAAVLAVAIGLSVSSCTSATADTAAASTTTSTAIVDERVAVEAAYRSAIAAFEAALTNPSADSGRLAAWWADPALSAARSQVNTWAGFGQALRYPEGSRRSLDVLSVSVAGDSATVTACFVDDGQVIDASTGRVLNDKVATVVESAVLHQAHGGWVLTERAQLDRSEGEQACAGE